MGCCMRRVPGLPAYMSERKRQRWTAAAALAEEGAGDEPSTVTS